MLAGPEHQTIRPLQRQNHFGGTEPVRIFHIWIETVFAAQLVVLELELPLAFRL